MKFWNNAVTASLNPVLMVSLNILHPTLKSTTQVFNIFSKFSRGKLHYLGMIDTPVLTNIWFKHSAYKIDVNIANIGQFKWSLGITQTWNYNSDHTGYHTSFKKYYFYHQLCHKYDSVSCRWSQIHHRHGQNWGCLLYWKTLSWLWWLIFILIEGCRGLHNLIALFKIL